MKRVLIRPTFHDWCENKLFTQGTSFSAVYQEAFSLWKQQAAKLGFQLDTWDQAPLDTADIFWFLDLPPSRREFERIRTQLKPNTPIVLQILESPFLAIHALHQSNTKDFDAVLTYQHPNIGHFPPNYYHYRLPNQIRYPQTNIPFAERKGLSLINSNRIEGFLAMRQVGLAGLPAIGKFLSGWHCSIPMFREAIFGELYSHRRQIAKLAESLAPDFLDLYGRGWNGEQISWCPLYINRPYKCWRGIPNISKWQLCEQYKFVLGFENFQGDLGYISEKIFDPIFAGSIPVYLGDDKIQNHVPPEVFIDARNFDNYTELLQYLLNFNENKWKKMKACGQDFLNSNNFKDFHSSSYANIALNILKQLNN
ncbi:MAG: glycosyltransferase family 10 [Aphanizomenon gracile PMC644.10]|nr:glycosyltransferase family 10 [Aphanizomenon gracile PMC644.10]